MSYLDRLPKDIINKDVLTNTGISDKMILLGLYPHLTRTITFTPNEQTIINDIINSKSCLIDNDGINFLSSNLKIIKILKSIPYKKNIYIIPIIILDFLISDLKTLIYDQIVSSQKWKDYFDIDIKGHIKIGNETKNPLLLTTAKMESIIKEKLIRGIIDYTYSDFEIANFIRLIEK